jgi:hypothetical protein
MPQHKTMLVIGMITTAGLGYHIGTNNHIVFKKNDKRMGHIRKTDSCLFRAIKLSSINIRNNGVPGIDREGNFKVYL